MFLKTNSGQDWRVRKLEICGRLKPDCRRPVVEKLESQGLRPYLWVPEPDFLSGTYTWSKKGVSRS